MCYLLKIFDGELKNNGTKAFEFTIKDYKKVRGVFASGETNLSLAFDNGKNILVRNFEQRNTSDNPPNKRPLLFDKAIEMEIIKGVIISINKTITKQSIYLILDK